MGDLPERLESGCIWRDPDPYEAAIESRRVDDLATEALMLEAAARIRSLEGEVENWRSRAAERDAECERRFRAQHAAEAALAKAVEGLEKTRDGYASQAQFADPEPAAWFREFVRRIDKVLSTIRQEPKG